MTKKYAKIIVDNRASQVDRPYTYIVGDQFSDLLKRGMRVAIPFGKGNKVIKGIVIEIVDKIDTNYRLKEIVDVLDDKPLIPESLIDLGLWMKEYYISSYLDALQTVLPPGDYKEIRVFAQLTDINKEQNLNDEEKQIISILENNKRILIEDIKKKTNISNINRVLNGLEEKNIIETTIDIKTTVEKKYEKWIKIIDNNMDIEKMYEIIGSRATKQREIMGFLYNIKDISFKEFSLSMSTSLSTVKALEEKGLVSIYEKEINRDPIKKEISKYKKLNLSKSQRLVYDNILDSFHGRNQTNKFLIHGVTGSGKTEVYLQLVEEILRLGRDSIILVPEISLTPQTTDRFVGRFGEEVAILHSRLSFGERFDEWRKIKEGKVKIVIGARSAVFAPFKNLGLIIIDEEHEATYKSSQNPKYDTIEVAAKRVDLDKGFLVLGSATPSIETYFKSKNKEIKLLELPERVNNTSLPEVKIIDMREELNNGNKSIFSKELYNGIKDNLEDKKQIILFLNRRGFSTFVSCRNCGYVVKCNDCEISMTYHRRINKLKCHYCGIGVNPPNICPVCKSNYIKYFGIGTEKVEEMAKELFPMANIVRMDMDTTRKKGSHESILEDMKNKKIDILIGTQMISKGLDFENVTLVGVIAADTSLNLPDFRSPERTFQLITQVSGRAGRGDYKGKVILQTYEPSHYSIEHAKHHDYNNFYNTEIGLRKEFLYPPYINIINILIYGENNLKVASISKEIYNLIREKFDWIPENHGIKYIIGPNPAPIEKIKNNFRWQIILKTYEKDIGNAKSLIKRVCIDNEYKLNYENIKISIQINPNTII